MKKANKISTISAIASIAGAMSASAAEISTNTAVMQAMDKITGQVSLIEVPVNQETTFGTFSIVVRECKTRTPEETPEKHLNYRYFLLCSCVFLKIFIFLQKNSKIPENEESQTKPKNHPYYATFPCAVSSHRSCTDLKECRLPAPLHRRGDRPLCPIRQSQRAAHPTATATALENQKPPRRIPALLSALRRVHALRQRLCHHLPQTLHRDCPEDGQAL